MWTCNVCNDHIFEDYEEACRHEETCKIQQEAAKRANKYTMEAKRHAVDFLSERAKKKQRSNPCSNNQHSLLLGNPLALSLILAFLDKRDILNLFLCSKAMRSFNSLAYEHVIRLVLLQGKIPQLETMANLLYQIQLERIYVPSIPRLLRLTMTGKGCELCGNRKNKRDIRSGENGIAYCAGCNRKQPEFGYKNVPSGSYEYSHPRVAGRHDISRLILMGEARKTRDGEWAGSIIVYDDLPTPMEMRSWIWDTFDRILEKRDKRRNPNKRDAADIVEKAMQIMEEAPLECGNHGHLQAIYQVLVDSSNNPNHRLHRPMALQRGRGRNFIG